MAVTVVLIPRSARVAKFVNSYPNIEVQYEIEDQDSLNASTPVTVNFTLDREVDEDGTDDHLADAPLFPSKKMTNWWIVIGDATEKVLYGIKKVTIRKTLSTKLEFSLPQGSHKLKLYLICDSYMGAFQ